MAECLYPRKMINKRYLPNKANHGIPPQCPDERLKYIYVPCGKCFNCLQNKKNEIKMRLMEEIRLYKDEQGYRPLFMTLDFGNEKLHLKKDLMEYGHEYAYEITKKCIQRFINDIRNNRHPRKQPRYFLISELGENNGRLHYHGIMWISREEYYKYWKYGITNRHGAQNGVLDGTGKYVNEKTINYILQYIVKQTIDPGLRKKGYRYHILKSKGFGARYLESNKAKENKYNGEQTDTRYRLRNGQKISLPRYLKQKLYTAEEREFLQIVQLNRNEKYIKGTKYDMTKASDRKAYEQIREHDRQFTSRYMGITREQIDNTQWNNIQKKHIAYYDYARLSDTDKVRKDNLQYTGYFKTKTEKAPF